MSDRTFDRTIKDRGHGHSPMQVCITRHDNDSDIQINLSPADDCWPRTTFFLTGNAAVQVATALVDATAAGWYVGRTLTPAPVVPGWDLVEPIGADDAEWGMSEHR